MLMLRVLLVCAACAGALAAKGQFGYSDKDGPSTWTGTCSDGTQQSPIDFNPADAFMTCDFDDITFRNYNSPLKAYTVKNSGTSVVVSSSASSLPSIRRGGLDGEFDFLQFHFHWGKQQNEGSEHEFLDFSYPIELHIVHARDQKAGRRNFLAVLGIFFKVVEDGDERATALQQLTDSFSKIKNKDDTTSGTDLRLADLLPENRQSFFRYNGSLTTPGCDEAVQWTVFMQHKYITKSQLAAFRSLLDGKSQQLVNNYRPPQPVNDRKVYLRVKPSDCAGFERKYGNAAPALLPSLLTLAAAALALL